jgi:ELWxxDGT repeat protein
VPLKQQKLVMKKGLQLLALLVTGSLGLQAQVTQINSNKSLSIQYPIGNKLLLVSDIDNTLWVTDATAAGTVQLSSTIKFIDGGGMLNDKLFFTATTPATGAELFVTDGTVAGTKLVKDIYTGASGSVPDDAMAELNGFIYFTAETPAEGRELWKTDGTTAGTTLVKDIIPGTAGSNTNDDYDLFSAGSYLLLNVKTAAEGNELWRSDGTAAGTVLLKDINAGAVSSSPASFYQYNNMVFFSAKTAANGIELWKTDGTTSGTVMLKDINPGVSNGFTSLFFYPYNGRAYFTANDGVTGDEIWSTDGTTANTVMLKDIAPGPLGSHASLFTAIKLSNKIIFSAFTLNNGFELWESDGTAAGTKLFKDIVPGEESSMASIFPLFSWGTTAQPLFQGNKFFFMATTVDEGSELWISDGTSAGTHMVKDINPGDEDGVQSFSFLYTTTALYFTANDGVNGDELWKSDGTAAGTSLVADINPGVPDGDIFFSFFFVNNKALFQANNGDHMTATDLYRIDADLAPLPVTLLNFNVSTANADALLSWSTSQEVNTKDFTVQRSIDGVHFTTIGTVGAEGNTSTKQSYGFTDKDIMNTAKNVIYYRLLVNDKNGKSTATRIVMVKSKAVWNVSLTNNPVQQNEIGLLMSGVTGPTQLSVVDATGKLVIKQSVQNPNGLVTLQAQHLTPGVYLLVAQKDEERKVIRFIKQ